MTAFIAFNWVFALGPLTSESHADYTLKMSLSSNRANPTPLAGAVVSGRIYVFLSPSTGVTRVRYFLDNPTMTGTPRQIENNPPFDFAGGDVAVARPFDTSRLSGSHTITALLNLSTGRTAVVNATFRAAGKELVVSPIPLALKAAPGGGATMKANVNSVGAPATVTVSDDATWLSATPSQATTPTSVTLTANAKDLRPGRYIAKLTASAAGFPSATHPVELTVETPSGASLLLSSSSNRSSPRALAGASVSGNIFVFLGPATGINRVRFFFDDPGMSGSPFQTESLAPYDLAGGTSATANPYDTRRLANGQHTLTAAADLSAGGTAVVSAAFAVSNDIASPPPSPPPPSPPPPSEGTVVSIQGDRFYIDDVITHPGKPAEGLLMNARMVNSVFEDTTRSDFNPEANTDEFIAAMPDYVAHGIRAFSVSLQGGNPSYEGAVNTAFRSDGSLKATYLARVKRVIERADSLGAVIILGLYYQRQDEYLASSTAVKAGVVNVMNWLKSEGFGNVLVEIANEYTHSGFDHSIIRSATGMASLIRLAKATAPQLYISASGYGDGLMSPEVADASDFILIHANSVANSSLAQKINALKSYGKPIVINEDTETGSAGADAARIAVDNGASWGVFLRKNQSYPFVFQGAADDPTIYQAILSLTTQ